MSLSQFVAVLIERWDELDGGVKAEIVNLLRGGWFGEQPIRMLILCFYI